MMTLEDFIISLWNDSCQVRGAVEFRYLVQSIVDNFNGGAIWTPVIHCGCNVAWHVI
jgi:hypothetical protein